MTSELDVRITAGLAVAIAFVLAVLEGPEFSKNILSVVSNAVAITALIRFLYLKWIWKWSALRWLECVHSTPYLEGKWSGQFDSSGNEKTPADRLSGQVDVEIRQPTLHKIRVVRRSDESTSQSSGEEIRVDDDGTVHLTYSYLSVPKATVRDRSGISFGTARLALLRENPLRLEGNYWTDQGTTGTLILRRETD